MGKVSYKSGNWVEVYDNCGLDVDMWHKRSIVMSEFIDESDESVMDMGAGDMFLKKCISNTVRYIPVDYEKRYEQTIVCDFNKGDFPNVQADVVVCAGILEYLDDPFEFLKKCTSISPKKIILSHIDNGTASDEDIVKCLSEQGFVITKQSYKYKKWNLLACFEKITPTKLGDMFSCYGCGACKNICRNDAIDMIFDIEGFLKPKVDEAKCTNCGLCISTCPSINIKSLAKTKRREEVKCYAAWASDEIRLKSSSGGVFSVLAQKNIEDKGHVYACTFDGKKRCVIEMFDDINNIDKFRHSKYIQSDTQTAFRKVEDDLKNAVPVLYVGTPCQIAGLKSYLHSVGNILNWEKLILVDLLCAYAPPMKWFLKYFEEAKAKYGDIDKVVFREKKVTGWSPFGFRVDKTDGGSEYPKYEEDDYALAFHSYIMRHERCEHCSFADFPRQGDISLGDFWGINDYDNTWDDRKGTSVVVSNTDKGDSFLNAIKDRFKRIEQVPIDWPSDKSNRVGTGGLPGHPNKQAFFNSITNHSFHDTVKMTLNYEDEASLKRSENFLESIAKDSKDYNLVAFGAGSLYCRTAQWISKYRKFDYLVDSNMDRWGREIEGLKCNRPDKLLELKNVIVIITVERADFTTQIIHQLLNMGISNFDHVLNWINVIKGEG